MGNEVALVAKASYQEALEEEVRVEVVASVLPSSVVVKVEAACEEGVAG